MTAPNAAGPTLTPADRAVLFTLMAHADEITSPQLQAEYGLRLEKDRRERLNAAGLVTSQRRWPTFGHELTDAGWAWCSAELAAGAPPGSDTGTRALYAVLGALHRYLNTAELTLADVVSASTAGSPTDRIRAAYADLADGPGDWVGLRSVRARLSDLPRDVVDEALLELAQQAGVRIEADDNLHGLTEQDRADAIRIHGVDRHLILVES